jgi:hypothetical protein
MMRASQGLRFVAIGAVLVAVLVVLAEPCWGSARDR